jgi:hypothetical protein
MSLIAKREPKILTPSGVYDAICVNVIDLGVHTKTFKNDMSDHHLVYIGFELPELAYEYEGTKKQKLIGREYKLSLDNRANLRKHLESWRSRPFTNEELEGFDLKNLLGVHAQVNIIHKTSKAGNQYELLESIIKHKGEKFKNVTPLTFYSITEHKTEIPETIPRFLNSKIKESKTYQHIENLMAEEEYEKKRANRQDNNPPPPSQEVIEDEFIDEEEIPF